MRGMMLVAVALAACRTYAYDTASRKPAPRSALEDQPVARHRKRTVAWADITVVNRGPGWFAAPAAPPVASVVAAVVDAGEKLVLELWFELEADDVTAVAAAVAERVAKDGGRVVSSSVEGGERDATSAALELRVPPVRAAAFATWLAAQGELASQKTLASDVGKLWRDQELELANLELTMSRLQALAAKDVPIAELLEIEKELTRVRGELERVKGEHRWLADRVELATVTITITRDRDALRPSAATRLQLGAHVATLVLLDPGMRPRARLGGGATLHLRRHLTFDLDVFPADVTDSRALVATVGTALYSGHLGFGRRRVANPYLGARIGYGYLSGGHATVLAGELGLELVRRPYLLLEVAARAVVFVHDGDGDAALHALAGAAVPF